MRFDFAADDGFRCGQRRGGGRRGKRHRESFAAAWGFGVRIGGRCSARHMSGELRPVLLARIADISLY